MSNWYVILGEDVPDSLPMRMQTRAAHLERMRRLQDEGRVLVAGPFPAIDSPDPGPAGFMGSLIVARFDSLDAARAWANDDPYVRSGVWRRVEVKPFVKVMP
ncbi:MAG: YciI family protein [Betaproteobacteria bacterium]|nr:YciI family protein [Betaproteobacteria bacterium]